MKIELTEGQLATIDEALQQMPYNIAAPLIYHISQQKRSGSGFVTLAINVPEQSDLTNNPWGKHNVPAIWDVKSDQCLMEPLRHQEIGVAPIELGYEFTTTRLDACKG
ncbi:hypothetical protein M2O40_003942 [Kluyvera ascorbata]|nr:hypothetical protein [Kluyvera ascorbata]